MSEDNYVIYFMEHVEQYNGRFSPWQCACEWDYQRATADEVEEKREALWDYYAYATNSDNQQKAAEGDDTMMLNEWPAVHHTPYFYEWLENIELSQ